MSLQRIPHDTTKYRNNPVELLNISNRNRIGIASDYAVTANTKLLITGTGTNNSTTIVDSTGKTVTRYGDTKISTTQSIIGGSSIYFDGSGDYLSLADSDDWNFGSGNFTIDFWVNLTSIISYGVFCATMNTAGTNGFCFRINDVNGLSFAFHNGSLLSVDTTGWSPTIGTFYHIAVSKQGSTLKFFVDGVQIGSNQTLSGTITDGGVMGIFRHSPDNTYAYHTNGYLSYLRITKGQALWTSNFTLPNNIISNNYIGA